MLRSRTAVFHSTDKPFELREPEVPELRAGEILVRNEFTTLCRSDLNTYCGKRTEKSPTILGHEIVGRIEAIGPDAPEVDLRGAALKIGDRITWAIYASCPHSEIAERGMPQKGEDLFKYGHEEVTAESDLHGGLGEYCVLRKHTPIVRIDEEVPLAIAALINCAVSTAAGSIRLAGEVGGRSAIVTGAGMLGLIAVAMLRARGVRRIVAIDTNEERLEMARRFGADEAMVLEGSEGGLKALLKEESFDLGFDFSGSPDSMEATMEVLGVGGIALWIGATYPQRDLKVNAEYVVRKLLTMKGLHNYNADDLVTAVDFVEQWHGKFPLAELVSATYKLSEIDAAFEHGVNSNAYRVGIELMKR